MGWEEIKWYWGTLFGPLFGPADWFGQTRSYKPSRYQKGFEEHNENLRWIPGNFVHSTPHIIWPRHFFGEYQGRPDWWSELGWESPAAHRCRERPIEWKIREYDEMWWDPPVKKGTSVIGDAGYDTTYLPGRVIKGTEVRNLDEWHERTLRENQISGRIYEKYDISPEHRHMRYAPAGVGDYQNFQPNFNSSMFGNVQRYGSFTYWGPHFYDKPLNECCWEKAGACAKNAFFFSLPITATHLVRWSHLYNKWGSIRCVMQPLNWLRVIPKKQGRIVVFAGVWGWSMCLASDWRGGRDDIYNYWLAAAPPALMIWGSHPENGFRAFFVYMGLSIAGFFWGKAKDNCGGFMGPEQVRNWSFKGPHDTQNWHMGRNPKPYGRSWWEDGPELQDRHFFWWQNQHR